MKPQNITPYISAVSGFIAGAMSLYVILNLSIHDEEASDFESSVEVMPKTDHVAERDLVVEELRNLGIVATIPDVVVSLQGVVKSKSVSTLTIEPKTFPFDPFFDEFEREYVVTVPIGIELLSFSQFDASTVENIEDLPTDYLTIDDIKVGDHVNIAVDKDLRSDELLSATAIFINSTQEETFPSL